MKSDYLSKRSIDGVYGESAGEYTLPDFNSDVRKVLYVHPTLAEAGSFVGDGGITFTGCVSYSIVYLDFENNLSHCEFSTDYEYRVKCECENYVDVSTEAIITNYNVRLVGPRKFSAKCAIGANVFISERRETLIEGDMFDSESPECLSSKIRVAGMLRERSSEREYAEMIEHLDGVMSDECDVIVSSSGVRGESITNNGSALIYKGTVNVSCLVLCKGEVPHRASVDIPFETKFFEGEEIGQLTDVSARIDVLSSKCTVVPDNDGVSITASIITECEMIMYKNTDVEIVKDVYSTKCGCDNKYGKIGYSEHLCLSEERFDIREKMPLEDAGCEGVRNVLFSDARGRVSSSEVKDGKLYVNGEIRFGGIACQINEAGVPQYVGVKIDVPFEEYVNNSCQLEPNDEIFVSCSISDVAIDVDGTYLMPRCSVKIIAEANRRMECESLTSSYMTDEKYSDGEGVVTVYYPLADETLYDVAKKYHKTRVSVAGVNSITEAVFNDASSSLASHGIKRLIIR